MSMSRWHGLFTTSPGEPGPSMTSPVKCLAIVDFSHFPYPFVPQAERSMGRNGLQTVLVAQNKAILMKEVLRTINDAFYFCCSSSQLDLIGELILEPREKVPASNIAKNYLDLSDLRHAPQERAYVLRRKLLDDFPSLLCSVLRGLNLCPRMVLTRFMDKVHDTLEYSALCDRKYAHWSRTPAWPETAFFPSIHSRTAPQFSIKYTYACEPLGGSSHAEVVATEGGEAISAAE